MWLVCFFSMHMKSRDMLILRKNYAVYRAYLDCIVDINASSVVIVLLVFAGANGASCRAV